MRNPDYNQLLKVLNKQVPDRPTLFEFFLHDSLYEILENGEAPIKNDEFDFMRKRIYGFKNAGYDYCTLHSSNFSFPQKDKERKSSISLNDADSIADWASYETYKWPDPDAFDYESLLDTLAKELPEGMKFLVMGPGGVLENVIALVGYEKLCYMLFEDPDLVGQIFDDVGSRLVRYYELSVEYDSVFAIISNDDWGFRSQTMLSPQDMRKYVFPWHKKIVAAAHEHNKPAMLHSCGQLENVMPDIIDDMKYDGKHSYEDTILPVEDAYDEYKGKIAVLGGIDLDFLCRSSTDLIEKRAKAMFERSAKDGGYALGSGNSIPDYVPTANYIAMIDVVRKMETM